jgi:NitT/TauT family transport system substrate-binding protein
MKNTFLAIMLIMVIIITGCTSPTTTANASKPEFTVMWSIYAGWMPWPYAEQSGILKKWADKYNIKINLQRADYIPSIEAYVSGKADAVVMTNMEALDMAASAGVDNTAVIIGDYSNGNDAVLTRNGLKLCDLKGKTVSIVELSVSQYLLERGLELNCKGVTNINDLNLSNTSDSDIGPGFITNDSQEAVVTWNPIVLNIEQQLGSSTTRAFDSSSIPYEILDIMFVNTKILNAHPELAQALRGAWFETMQAMKGDQANSALTFMAKEAGTDLDSFKAQLKTTRLFTTADDEEQFLQSGKLTEVMDLVRNFAFTHKLLTNAKTVDTIGIQTPNGTILGDKQNIKLRFNIPSY